MNRREFSVIALGAACAACVPSISARPTIEQVMATMLTKDVTGCGTSAAGVNTRAVLEFHSPLLNKTMRMRFEGPSYPFPENVLYERGLYIAAMAMLNPNTGKFGPTTYVTSGARS